MEKQKRWQFYLIIAVIVLTLYNILPTVFYYAHPLKDRIDASKANTVATAIVERVNSLEEDSQEWVASFSRLLGIKPTDIAFSQENPRLIEVSFKTPHDANVFRHFLPRAGAAVPFVPAQLELNPGDGSIDSKKVVIARQISVHLNPQDADKLFLFSSLRKSDGSIADLYQQIVYGRLEELAAAFGGPSRQALQLKAIADSSPSDSQYDDTVVALAREIVDMGSTFGQEKALLQRYYASFAQSGEGQNDSLLQAYSKRAEALKKQIDQQLQALQKEQKDLVEQGVQISSDQKLQRTMLENQSSVLGNAVAIIQKNAQQFKSKKPLTRDEIRALLKASAVEMDPSEQLQVVDLEGRNPFVSALVINWKAGTVQLRFYDDVQKLRTAEGKTEALSYSRDKINQYVINDIALAAQRADEHIVPSDSTYAIFLNKLTDSQSFLAFNLSQLAAMQSGDIQKQLESQWQPQHGDLSRELFPIHSYQEFKQLKNEQQKLGLVVYAPAAEKDEIPQGIHPGSIYVIAKGLDFILQKYRESPNAPDASVFMEDVDRLNTIMQQNGFISYSGTSYGMPAEFSKDYIFELSNYYNNILDATREAFTVKGDKRFAVLDFTDVEQRILALNHIDDRIQEDLLKWKESYNASQVDINVTNRYYIPAPTKNVYWENFKLSFAKYFRGDERKILKWGLDLSGGKTVRIGLRDQSNRPVTNPDDINKAVNELYDRVNKMGVAERTIHVENNNIILDFPGSQALSASELIKASAMYFHIVNEKFTPHNANLKDAVNRFLQNVWNEAVVTNRKDVESINEIAWQHLGAENSLEELTRPRSEEAKILFENGLRLPNPKTASISSAFNDTLSSIAVMRGDEISSWDGQTHPLLVVFHNFALEGANLTNVRVGYDSTQGNNLSFAVKRSSDSTHSGDINPQESFYAWTSQFSADKVVGTPKEAYSQGRGWRMAVILNGSIISMPTLQAALKDGGTISGRFSQREINQLAADLKAGSLSFTPRILSEENVSPELGKEERMRGAMAAVVALILVVVSMVGYYHFAGVVASCAVLFNILIMWGVLQNLGAALSLPTIAGIVLTIAMAIDANVLVFERVREEFSVSGRIASAIQAGYRKAFSAIIDSNITTIMAAFILIQFDSGPIKGFAVALIVGVVSSMFTALFMTRYYFAGWVQKPENRSLHMSQFFSLQHFDFLGQTKKAVIISVLAMVLGTFLFIAERNTMFAMDFTGGYALNVEVQDQPDHPNYRLKALEALQVAGASINDVQVRELSRPNQLRIQLGMGMEEKGSPFYQMPELDNSNVTTYAFQENPRMVWVVNALEKAGMSIPPNQLAQLDKNWTVMSGQFSQAMRTNAIIGLAAALLCILLYITVRFEFKYAVGAVVGLVHDVIITLGILAFFHWMGMPVNIDLSVIGALMTIVGYSLNDTIIIFDRIREDIKVLRKQPFNAIVNHALNVTLSRTVMTSGTTLLVLLALLFLGGHSIFAFSLVMTIGVFVGTLSSLFIAAPVMIWCHNYELKKQQNADSALRKA